MAISTKSARVICESLLTEERRDRVERAILPSEVEVIDRLLARGLELNEAYEELVAKLSDFPKALKVFFDQLQSTAAFWSPEANIEARKGRTRLTEVNRQIGEAAAKLADLLDLRTELHNHSGFSSDTYYHPIDVLHMAAAGNYSYQQWIKGRLDSICGQFDLKYWPSLGAFAQAIADDAARATPQSQDPLTYAGTEGVRPSLADSFKASRTGSTSDGGAHQPDSGAKVGS